jgi:ribosomal protein L11 methyltransferase
LMIVPAGMELPSMDRIPLKIDPGMAFGTGTHPTTQLCLEMLESMVLKFPDSVGEWDMIDVGCGTGILAIAALKLGLRRALGVDIDEDAIKAARETADNNKVGDRLDLRLGSLAEIRAGASPYQKAQIVFTNILAPVLVRMMDEGLIHLISPSGYLVMSGILVEQVEEVNATARQHGLYIVERRQSGDWVALNYRLEVIPEKTK